MKRHFLIVLTICIGLLLATTVLAGLDRRVNNPSLHNNEIHATIIDVGTLDGSGTSAQQVNKDRQVVGVSLDDSNTITDGQAYVWANNVITPLGPPGYEASQANGLNDAGMIAGAILSPGGGTPFWEPVVWHKDTVTKLLTLSDTHHVAQAINEHGEIVGYAKEDDGPSHALLWHGNTITELGTLGGDGSRAWDINDTGRVVGEAGDEDNETHAFLWYQGVMTDLGTLSGTESAALAINASGRVVGWVMDDTETKQAFVWQNGVMTALDVVDDASPSSSQANDINDRGEIVGWAMVGGEQHAVLWRNGVAIDLNDWLASDSGWERLETANAINHKGWIAGTGYIGGEQHGFLLMGPQLTYLPLVFNAPIRAPYDMVDFLVSDGRLYEVQHSGGSQARHQTQMETEGTTFYHTKGNEFKAEWEELWYTQQHIYRGTDTSPGSDMYYTLRDTGIYGSRWAPRYWDVGGLFERNPLVTFYRKSDCTVVHRGYQRSWLKFDAFYPRYNFPSGITLNNVVQLSWLLSPTGSSVERYYYAEDYGLVGWWSNDRGMSYISEIHEPGTRPDNKRESIPCLNRSALRVEFPSSLKLYEWPGLYQR